MGVRASLGVVLLLFLFVSSALAQADQQVAVALGGSTVLSLDPSQARRVTLTDPSVAEIQAVSGGLLVIGRKVGETNLVLFGDAGAQRLLVKVTLPAQAIQGELSKMFPREDIEARAVGGSLVLVGAVSSTPLVQQVEDVAMGYLRSPSIKALGVEPHVINLLRVRDRQQVQLEVKFAEVNRRSLREMGVNFAGRTDGGRVGGIVGQPANNIARGVGTSSDLMELPGNGETPTGAGGASQVVSGYPIRRINALEDTRARGALPFGDAIGSIFVGMNDGPFPFAATLSLLAQRDLAKTLAEPTLVALSGQKADFQVGGEVAIPISGGLGNVTIQFKKFGILLAFTPTVLMDSTVQINTEMEVSAPDDRFGVLVDNILTPGFRTRRSATTVRMRDGQSFAIAGLLSDEVQNSFRKVPGLGDLPILGLLFSSKEFERNETELVVVVTVRLVDPIEPGDLPPLPGDEIGDPTDVQLFLLNFAEVEGKPRVTRRQQPRATGPRQPSGALGFWR